MAEAASLMVCWRNRDECQEQDEHPPQKAFHQDEQGVADSTRSWGREMRSSLHLSDSIREKQRSEFRVPLPHKPRLARQGTTAAFGTLWTVIYQRWKHTQNWELLHFQDDWSWFQVSEVVLEQGGQSCSLKVRAELLPQPQGTAPLSRAVTHPAVTPAGNQGISLPFPPQDTNILSQDWLQGEAMPTATAYSYCFGSCRDLRHREKQSSPKCPSKAWGGKSEIHSSSWGSKEAPGHRHKRRWQCWRRSSK